MESFNEKVFYHIYPLGFCGAPEKNDFHFAPVERLNKITEWIGHMKRLGVNALYLGPVFESAGHGYDTANYYQVDRRLGTNATLKNLVGTLHENGIAVVLDGVFNHVGREFFAFKDIINSGQGSRFKHWFDGVDFGRRSPCGDRFTYNTWAGHYDLVKLNPKSDEVVGHLIGAARYWIDEFGIDGIRLDAADCLDFDFMRKLSDAVKGVRPDFWIMGEVIHGDYGNWVRDAHIDSTTNYECYKGLYSSHNDRNYFEIAHSLRRQFAVGGIYRGLSLYNFADNHDVERVASSLKNRSHLYPLYTLLFTMPGIPSIYYGSEWGLEGRKANGSDKSLRPALEIGEMKNSRPDDLVRHISKLSEIRKGSRALKYGSYGELFVKSEQFGFVREHEGETVAAVFNSSGREAALEDAKIPPGKYIDVLNEGAEIDLRESRAVDIFPNWSRILVKAG